MKITHVNKMFGGQCEAVTNGDTVTVTFQYSNTSHTLTREQFLKEYRAIKIPLLDKILLCLGLL